MPYYEAQTNWRKSDYYCLHRYLHRMIWNHERRLNEIRSIGGYAMLRHGLRVEEDGSGFTEDIDSLTDTFNDDIQVLINEVAEEQLTHYNRNLGFRE